MDHYVAVYFSLNIIAAENHFVLIIFIKFSGKNYVFLHELES